ncbi:phospholipase A and acyltransferase 4-like [Anneissia japonica]|uniref:phospholipase A and acyltransferase 4-like n=1 Tax=Anneissia japonica TaxID=1529436 RepID=UPI0014256856|nr:phospholipase A and acyltransferase 4-like [Anneissia japonica]
MDSKQLLEGDLIRVERKNLTGINYWHWGVYIGDGNVIHFSGPPDSNISLKEKHLAEVRQVTIKQFLGDDTEFQSVPFLTELSRAEVVERAKSQVGRPFRDSSYELPYNNCEHFARWCHGKAESKQVQNAVLWAAIGSVIALGAGILFGASVSYAKRNTERDHENI